MDPNINSEQIMFTLEGKLCAFGSLIAMAMISVFVGSYRSVLYHKQQKELGKKPDSLSRKDAGMFPVKASVSLLLIYYYLKMQEKEKKENISLSDGGLLSLNFDTKLLITGYIAYMGVMAMVHIMRPITNRFIPRAFPVIPYHLIFNKGENETKKSLIDLKFDSRDFVTLVICGAIGVWYLFTKHWIANNVIALAGAVYGIELLHLNSVVTGCILLSGLFLYDIFWVFGTDVMMTIALSLDAPIKLLFPQDFLGRGVYGTQFALLGLGDIVIPGIFMALLLRFDVSLKRKTNVYFYASYVAYFLGLMMSMAVSVYYKSGQPALLYLVPLCTSFPLFVALIRGDIKALFGYEDYPSAQEIQVNSDNSSAETTEEDSKKVQ